MKESIQLHTTGTRINEFTVLHHMAAMDSAWNDSCAGSSTVIIFEKFACIHDFWIDANLKSFGRHSFPLEIALL